MIKSLRLIFALPFISEFLCSRFLVPALCVCLDHLAQLGARQRVLLSRGKIINHNLDGEGVRDGFYFHFRVDSSTGRQFLREGFSAAFGSVA